MKNIKDIEKKEIFHKDYNLDKMDNLGELPREKAVFGIFAIVNEEPINCRYVGETEDLQRSIRNLYESPGTAGMIKFMHGPWIPMLQFVPMPGSSEVERKAVVEEWTQQYSPNIDEHGEYPGYYDG